jgi:hypothetical protein
LKHAQQHASTNSSDLSISSNQKLEYLPPEQPQHIFHLNSLNSLIRFECTKQHMQSWSCPRAVRAGSSSAAASLLSLLQLLLLWSHLTDADRFTVYQRLLNSQITPGNAAAAV